MSRMLRARETRGTYDGSGVDHGLVRHLVDDVNLEVVILYVGFAECLM